MSNTTQVLVLLAHGSRHAEWARPFEAVRESVQAACPDLRVRLAFLEFMRPALREVLEETGQDGFTHARIVPLFLGTGGHLLRDIPAAVQEIQQRHPALKIEIAPPAGGEVEVLAALSAYAVRCAAVT